MFIIYNFISGVLPEITNSCYLETWSVLEVSYVNSFLFTYFTFRKENITWWWKN